MTDSLGVVIPAYQPQIPVLSGYVDTLEERLDPDVIRVEIDAPDADTRDQLSDLPVTVNAASNRRGKGAAVTTGFEALDTDVLGFVDADGSTPATEFGRIVAQVADESINLAVGSRRHPDATVQTSQSPGREHLGDGFAWFARQLLDAELYDYQCGAKAITDKGWQHVRQHLTRPGFAWDVELVAVAGALDLGVREVPIEWHDQPNSTVPPVRTSIQLATALVRAHRKAKRLDPEQAPNSFDGPVSNSQRLIERDPSAGKND